MFRKTIALVFLCLSSVCLSGAPDNEGKIAAARGREKLDLILRYLQDRERIPDAQATLLERYAREAVELSRQLQDRHAEGRAWRHVAYAESLRQRFLPALEDYFYSRRIFGEMGERGDRAEVDKEIGDLFATVFSVFSDFERAGESYHRSLAQSRQDGDPVATAKSLNNLANTYQALGNFKEAIPLYREALRLNEHGATLYDCGAILCDLSDACLKSGDAAESMSYMRQALVFFETKRHVQGRGRQLAQAGLACMKRNDFAGAQANFRQALELHRKYDEKPRIGAVLRDMGQLYSRFAQQNKARECLREALALQQRRADQIEILETILARAGTLQKQNDLSKAEALLRLCENQSEQKHLQGMLCETYLQLSSLYSRRKDAVNALYYQTLGKKTQDGLPSTAIQAGMQQLIAKHESNKVIGRIKGRQRRQTVISLLAIGALLVLSGVLAWKRKSVRKWVRGHLTSREQRLQKKKSQLREMQQKLGALRKKHGPGPDDDPGRDCIRQVLQKMENDKAFLDSELTLKKMAVLVGANTSSLSKALNQDLGMGFSEFINYFRVEEAKKIMLADDQDKWDAVDICYEVGFNSMSSFYRVFKMHTGTTPVEFQRACKK